MSCNDGIDDGIDQEDAGMSTLTARSSTETLRDRFAMAALTGMLACPNNSEGNTLDNFAAIAYAIADAMLKVRG